MKGILSKLIILLPLLLFPSDVSIAISIAVAFTAAVSIAVTVANALGTSTCKLLSYVSRHGMAGNYTLHRPTLAGCLWPLVVPQTLQTGFFTLQ